MTEVIPFRGIYYNNERVKGDDVMAPPYDVITPPMREALYRKSRFNIVRVDFGEELPADGERDNKYTRARALLDGWLRDGVLLREPGPCFYACRMQYGAGGQRRSLTGLFGLVRLVELGQGVYPHEATHSKPKQDRRSLMEVTAANTSPVYSLFRARDGRVREILAEAAGGDPYLEATDPDGTLHSFWPVREPARIEAIRASLEGAPIFIADGHHRYETALDYQRARRQADPGAREREPYDYVLMFLADIEEEGLTVLPTHRLVTVDAEGLVEKLSGHFDVETLGPDADIIEAIKGRGRAFGLYDGRRRLVLRWRGEDLGDVPGALRRLDVVVLHKMVLGKLLDVGNWAYEMDPALAMERVDGGDYDAAFFLNPTAVGDVEEVALGGLRMPPKSTYFYPKVQTGFVLNSINSF